MTGHLSPPNRHLGEALIVSTSGCQCEKEQPWNSVGLISPPEEEMSSPNGQSGALLPRRPSVMKLKLI